MEDNWWGTNNPQSLDKITINRWVVMDLSAELLDNLDDDLANEYNIANFDKKLNYYNL